VVLDVAARACGIVPRLRRSGQQGLQQEQNETGDELYE
jgi:hypothetical protein